VNQKKIDEYRALAEQHKANRKSARIIIELLDEIERLQSKDRFRAQKALTDQDSFPLGKKHRGEKMIDVPAEYLLWWWDNGGYDREAICIDAQFSKDFAVKSVARQKLRVHEYIRVRPTFHRLMQECPSWDIKHVPDGE